MRTHEYMQNVTDRLNRIGKQFDLEFLRDRHASDVFTAFIVNGWLAVSFDILEIENCFVNDEDLQYAIQCRAQSVIRDTLAYLANKSVKIGEN